MSCNTQTVRIQARLGHSFARTFYLQNNGTARDLTGQTLALAIWKPGATARTFNLTSGSGLTIGGSVAIPSLTPAQNGTQVDALISVSDLENAGAGMYLFELQRTTTATGRVDPEIQGEIEVLPGAPPVPTP
jgi:hypothetical protein